MCLGFLLLLTCVPALAATSTLNPTADAYVQAGSKNAAKNFGTATSLITGTSGTLASNYDSYLKFDTTSVPNITTAKLRLYAALSRSGSIVSTAYPVADTTWGETTITWNTKPALGVALGNITVAATTYGWYEIDVTSYVQSEFNAGRKVVSFAYHNSASSRPYINAHSKEGINKPQLLITYNIAPTVSLTAPAANSVFNAPANITLSATAADSDGTIAKVEFYADNILLGTSTTALYSFTWNSAPAGAHQIVAKAYDNLNLMTASAPVAISVNAAPAVVLTAPVANSIISAPANITLTANATDSDGTITQVDFYNGVTLLATATTAPYSFNWNNVAAGIYSLTAKATDNQGAVTTSATVAITINTPPTVSLTSPLNGSAYNQPANITLSANATDSDGSIAKVEFYDNATLLGTSTTAPYSTIWNNAPAGVHQITAQATDNLGTVTTSTVVNITVAEAISAPALYYIETDHLDTPRQVSDNSGKVVWRWESTDAFGANLPNEDADGDGIKTVFNLRMAGQYADKETGSFYNYYRDHYFSELGRYGQSDPIGLRGGSFSTYGYVGGNPVSFIDPMGLVLQYADAASDKAMRPSIKQIMTTPVGRKLLGKLNSDSQTYLIHSGFNSAGESNFQQGNDVYVDPNADIDVPQENACSTRKFSTTRILAHELGHLTGTEDGPSDAAMENVNKWENPIMFPLEKFNRTRYWK